MVVRKMKDKCKDAARMRREKERAEFVELSKLLPLPVTTTSQLDKASIIRLTSSYLRLRSAFPKGLGEIWGLKQGSSTGVIDSQQRQNNHRQNHAHHIHHNHQHHNHQRQQTAPIQPNSPNNIRELGSLILQALDGFVFALHRDGKIMYISETASVYLGLPQIDLTGSSIFDYVHPSDHNELQAMLTLKDLDKLRLGIAPGDDYHSRLMRKQDEGTMVRLDQDDSHNMEEQCDRELERSFCIRMKCILPKRNAGLVSSGYKAIHCHGYLKVRARHSNKTTANKGTRKHQTESVTLVTANDRHPQLNHEPPGTEAAWWESCSLVAIGNSLLPSAFTEIKLTSSSFMFRANLDLRLYYLETPAMADLLGVVQNELIGQSLYQLVHVDDIEALERSHRSLLLKGQTVTRYYRLMRKDHGFTWIQSHASLVSNPRNLPRPQYIVSICFVLGHDFDDRSSCLLNDSAQPTALPAVGESITKSGASDKMPSVVEHQTIPQLPLNGCWPASKDTISDGLMATKQHQVVGSPTKRIRKSRSVTHLETPVTGCRQPTMTGPPSKRLSHFELQQQFQKFDNQVGDCSNHHHYQLIASDYSSQCLACYPVAQDSHPVFHNHHHDQNHPPQIPSRRVSDDTCSDVSSVGVSSSISQTSSSYSSSSSAYGDYMPHLVPSQSTMISSTNEGYHAHQTDNIQHYGFQPLEPVLHYTESMIGSAGQTNTWDILTTHNKVSNCFEPEINLHTRSNNNTGTTNQTSMIFFNY